MAAAVAEEAEDHVKSAGVWTLGQIGRHTPNHARAVADTGVLLDFVTLEGDTRSSEDLKGKCRKALKAILGKLTHLPTLDVLLRRCALSFFYLLHLLLLCSPLPQQMREDPFLGAEQRIASNPKC